MYKISTIHYFTKLTHCTKLHYCTKFHYFTKSLKLYKIKETVENNKNCTKIQLKNLKH